MTNSDKLLWVPFIISRGRKLYCKSSPDYFRNVWVHTDVDDIKTCRRHANKKVANIGDKIEDKYGYDCSYINLQPLTCGMIVRQGGPVMMKNKS